MDPARAQHLVDVMRRYADSIERVVRRGRDEFFEPEELRNRATVEHYLELLGEAAGAIGRSIRAANPAIPWAVLTRFRFGSAHPYDDDAKPVNYDAIWRFASNELPPIARRLRSVKVTKK